jgi:hypothetical protein
MSLSDIFTSSVVISLAISLLLIGLLGLYVTNKLNEQNHKLNSMFDIVSTLAGELQMVRAHTSGGMPSASIGGGHVHKNEPDATTKYPNHLVSIIEVSDGEDESSSSEHDSDGESGEESDEESGEESGEESNGESDEESDEDSDEEEKKPVKPILVSESLEETHFEVLNDIDEIVLEEIKDISAKTSETTLVAPSNVKNLNVVFDYKKASITKLREIVEQKGIASDTSKLKKHDLLKLLDVE